MPVQVAIVGGGVGGTLIANRLQRLLHGDARHQTDVTVYDAEGIHTYQPGWLYVPFAQQDPQKLARPERRLLRENVTLLSGDAGRARRIHHVRDVVGERDRGLRELVAARRAA